MNVMFSIPALIIYDMVIKITMATPSLNKLSPVIFVSNVDGILDCFNIPNTAIGSVGEMSAPNNKQLMTHATPM